MTDPNELFDMRQQLYESVMLESAVRRLMVVDQIIAEIRAHAEAALNTHKGQQTRPAWLVPSAAKRLLEMTDVSARLHRAQERKP